MGKSVFSHHLPCEFCSSLPTRLHALGQKGFFFQTQEHLSSKDGIACFYDGSSRAMRNLLRGFQQMAQRTFQIDQSYRQELFFLVRACHLFYEQYRLQFCVDFVLE